MLNVAPTAVVDLDISNAEMRFNARFSGVATDVIVPISAALGIYARENGQGMLFDHEQPASEPPPRKERVDEKVVQRRSHLRLVK